MPDTNKWDEEEKEWVQVWVKKRDGEIPHYSGKEYRRDKWTAYGMGAIMGASAVGFILSLLGIL